MSKSQTVSKDDVDLSESFIGTGELGLSTDPPCSNNESLGIENDVGKVSLGSVVMACEQLVCDQKKGS